MTNTLGGGFEGEPASGATWRAPNISTDRETGIGAWLPQQIVGACHGEYLATLMHCAACHTASEGPTAGIAFAGGARSRIDDRCIVERSAG